MLICLKLKFQKGGGVGGVFLYEQKDLKVYSVHH